MDSYVACQFESYVKAAHSKALALTLVQLKLFESYVKAAHSKAT